MEMDEYKLEDVVNFLDYKRIPLSSKERLKRKGKYPYFGAQGIIDYVDGYLFDGLHLLVAEDGENLKSRKQKIAFLADGRYWVNNHAHILESNGKCDIRYICYLLNNMDIRGYISGSAQPKLKQEYLKSINLKLPSLKVQKHIADFIFKIDKKLALNRAINDNLEAMARQLYDYWFVQFDFPDENGKPYKSSGGKMVWNEKLNRNIPEGWHCGTLLDIAEHTNGLACQKYRPTDNNMLPVIKIKEMRDGFTSETESVMFDIPEEVKVYDGDVLFSWSASLEVMLWAYGNGGLNQHIFKVTSKNGYPRYYYYYQILEYIGIFKRMAEARKTTMGHITQDHLRQSTISLPPTLALPNMLGEVIEPIFDKIVANNEEMVMLTKQRDKLLPLLMNGQVSVNYHLRYKQHR